ncbi:hypothetical protein [Alkalibaculum bacchi]|uniref:dual OB domain-containing protein n=1 Tax=Alkalibaculum bacchi TaxID=645887 RepID=UPI0026F0095C|nr:hypothetical protein [Alkalibaculum bacchi]
MYREIIVLAKSSKHSEYCLAGVDTTTGEWIRPISSNIVNEGSVPIIDVTYRDGNQVQILDMIKIKLLSHKPTISQPENYLYDSNFKWEKTGQSSLAELVKYRGYDQAKQIFYNNGKEVSEEELSGQPSLLFVNVKDSCIFIKTFFDGNRRLQFNFTYNGMKYQYFKISDKLILTKFTNISDGNYNYRDDLPVVFSLTDKFKKTDQYYKMVAQMFY